MGPCLARLLGDASEAEDIVQEAFLKIFKAAPRYHPSAGFRTYLYQIVTRLCLDWQAKKCPDYTDNLGSIPDVIPGPEALLYPNELDDAVQKCLTRLPAHQRVTIILRHYDGMNYDEIADVLKVSSKAVDSLLQRARDTLRRALDGFQQTKPGNSPTSPFEKRLSTVDPATCLHTHWDILRCYAST
jgi:RNA polymerase sigma-70 factor (ECF subfamily)